MPPPCRNEQLLAFYGIVGYTDSEVIAMETKDVLRELRLKKGLSQEALAEQVHVTRQAVSRWETGETVPSTDTLKELSRVLDASINTLLGSPRQRICQCCGMPLTDEITSREPDGGYNEAYCQWCLADGAFVHTDPDELAAFLVQHTPGVTWTQEQAKAFLQTLDHWKTTE